MKKIVWLFILGACGSRIENRAPEDATIYQDSLKIQDAVSVDAPMPVDSISPSDALIPDAVAIDASNLPQINCLVTVRLSSGGIVFLNTIVSGCPVTQSATVIITLHFRNSPDFSLLQGGFGCGTTASASDGFSDVITKVDAIFSVDQTSISGDCTINMR